MRKKEQGEEEQERDTEIEQIVEAEDSYHWALV